MKRFLLALFLLLSVTSAGSFLTDEQRQYWAFENLRAGHLTIEEEAPHLFAFGLGGLNFGTFENDVGGRILVAHSEMVNFVSLPGYFVFEFADDVVPIEVLIVVVWGVLAYWGARWATDWGRGLTGRDRLVWARPGHGVGQHPLRGLADWSGRASPGHRALLAAVTALTVWQAWRVPAYHFDLWGGPLSVQLTMLLLAAAGAAVFRSLLARFLPTLWADAGWFLLLTGTSYSFWAGAGKYHILLMVLAIVATYAYVRGWQEHSLRWRAVGVAAAGLSLWAYASGVIIIFAMGVAELVHAGRGWTRLRSHVAAGLALVAGTIPFFLTNWAMTGNPLTNSYLARPANAADAGAASQTWWGTLLGKLGVEQDADYLGNSQQIFLFATDIEGNAVSILTLTPWLVAVLFLPWALRRGLRWNPGFTIAFSILVANWLAYAAEGPVQGGGYDLRYFTPSIPGLLFVAILSLHRIVPQPRQVVPAGAAAHLLAGSFVFAIMLALAHKNILIDWTDRFYQPLAFVQVIGTVAFAMIALTQVMPGLGAWRPQVFGVFLGLGLFASHFWVFTTQVIFHTGIPAHDGYPGFTHLIPLTEVISDWAIEHLIPPKWGIAPPTTAI